VKLRGLALGLVVGGAAVLVVGVLGLVFGWGSSEGSTAAAGAPNGSSAASTTVAGEDASTFLAAFAAALRTGNTGFLVARLDPVVTDRYGTAQCESAVAALADPSAQLTLVGVSGPASFDYASDGLSTSVPNVYTFHVTGTLNGSSTTRDYHFARVNGSYRIFLDCGNPLTTTT
jgi:hypothetical protein